LRLVLHPISAGLLEDLPNVIHYVLINSRRTFFLLCIEPEINAVPWRTASGQPLHVGPVTDPLSIGISL
jgi:hypothetical protein